MIFDSFSQADSSTTRQYGGTGLGLAISAKLVVLMGGELRVASSIGLGSTFYFEADFGRATTGAAAAPHVPSVLENLKVLVVDDNATNRQILEHTLLQWGAAPVCVASGAAALEALQRGAEANEHFTLLVVDSLMPEMNGFELVEEVRRQAELKQPTVIMLTSSDRVGDTQLCRRLGIAAYLTKPVRPRELQCAVLTALQGQAAVVASSPSSSRPDPVSALRALRILLAEDNVINQRVALRILEKVGHETTVVANGEEALAALEANTFDVVLMDVQMPQLDGLEATRRIRAAESAGDRRLPIIAMTAHAMKGDRERCLAAGMDDYVSKPIRNAELTAALERVLNLTSSPSTPTAAAVSPDTTAFDRKTALEVVGGDEEFLTEVIGLFLSDSPDRLREIQAAVAAKDGAVLERAAHALKGAAGYLGAEPTVAAAQTLEHIGKAGEWAAAPAAARSLEGEMSRLLTALAAEAGALQGSES